jgi:hypothetical protein
MNLKHKNLDADDRTVRADIVDGLTTRTGFGYLQLGEGTQNLRDNIERALADGSLGAIFFDKICPEADRPRYGVHLEHRARMLLKILDHPNVRNLTREGQEASA